MTLSPKSAGLQALSVTGDSCPDMGLGAPGVWTGERMFNWETISGFFKGTGRRGFVAGQSRRMFRKTKVSRPTGEP